MLTFFAVVMVLKVAETVFVTILVSFLFAFIMEIPVRFLRKRRVPLSLAVTITALIFFGLLAVLVWAAYRCIRNDYPYCCSTSRRAWKPFPLSASR